MFKLKVAPLIRPLLLLMLVILLSAFLIGCAGVFSRNAEPDVEVNPEGNLPGWLLLAHRTTEGPGSTAEEILNPKNQNEDTANEDAPAPEAAEPAPSVPATTAPAAPPPPTAPAAPVVDPNVNPELPGTIAYIIWERKRAAALAEEERKAAEEAKKAEPGGWFNIGEGTSPSGFR
ncbi:MAG TPA: hypothetical protein VLH18_00230 [Candidatus Limnocylindrales bacterium]|nr:hypothetical protein [Candidatus Limnocylindrales bacterium]